MSSAMVHHPLDSLWRHGWWTYGVGVPGLSEGVSSDVFLQGGQLLLESYFLMAIAITKIIECLFYVYR